jgi:hypothetical protein
MVTMTKQGRRNYIPAELSLWGGYSLPNYWHDLERSLTKNILAAAYDKPVTVSQLSAELGVAAPYVEEELERLLKGRFVKAHRHNEYYTDFVILPKAAYRAFYQEAGDAWDGIGRQLVTVLNHVKLQVLALNFYGKEFAWDYLLWIWLVFASEFYTQQALTHYKIKWEGVDLPPYTKDYRITGKVDWGQDDT